MKVIYLKTTNTCNLNCAHCFTNGSNGETGHFDVEQSISWIDEFIAMHPDETFHIEFHGGEPFIVPLDKLERVAIHFKDYPGVTMGANTNLTFKLTDELIRFIKTYFDSNVGTSWDLGIRWRNQRQYEQWLGNVRKLRENDITIPLKVAVTKELIAAGVDWFLETMSQLPVTKIDLERLTLDGNATSNMTIFPDNECQDNWYMEIAKRHKDGTTPVIINTIEDLINRLDNNLVKTGNNCRNCEQNLVTMNADGTLSGCPNAAATLKHATLTDGVKKFLLSDSRISEIAEELSWHDECFRCDVNYLCGGDCHRLPWQGSRCGGLKNTLRYLTGKEIQSDIIVRM